MRPSLIVLGLYMLFLAVAVISADSEAGTDAEGKNAVMKFIYSR